MPMPDPLPYTGDMPALGTITWFLNQGFQVHMVSEGDEHIIYLDAANTIELVRSDDEQHARLACHALKLFFRDYQHEMT